MAATNRQRQRPEPPKAPWSPFPLVELTILAGIVLLVLGVIGVAADRAALVVCGLALVSVASLELSLREHFAGYRSHAALLAGAATVLVVLALRFAVNPPHVVLLVAGAATFAVAFGLLRRAYRRRGGRVGFGP